MSLTKLGNTSLQVVDTRRQNSPGSTGESIIEVIEGDRDAINLLAFSYRNKRWNIYQQEGPVWRLEITLDPSDLGTEPEKVEETWDFETDLFEVDYRQHPNVSLLFVDSVEMNVRLKSLNDSIATGEAPDLGPANFLQPVFDFLSQGGRAFESERLVIRRNRTYPYESVQRFKPEILPTIYKRNALIDAFSIPGYISNAIPTDLTGGPPGTEWGWKRRQARSQFIPSTSKVTEVVDWVGAFWSTLLYNVQT